MEKETMQEVEQQIEISIEAAKEVVKRKEMMDELIADKRFEEVFTKGYLEAEPARLTSLLADPEWQTPEKQKELMDDLRAISGFRQYIMNIKALGRQMEAQIASSEQTLNELREEEGE